jgi:hypothetical protein|tara:strand:- start:800 stop:1468 length:669 start_codon:yes stop_codon:yes gene_type:complete
MAVAPLNKFITIAVPVAPGINTVYTAPVGVNAIVLYAGVSNVGLGSTTVYPTVTFTHQRKSTGTRTFGNTRDTRLVKDIEVLPNDTLFLIDGRLVLERTSAISDSLTIVGDDFGVRDISGVEYHAPNGVTTVTTTTPHGFVVGDEITMADIKFDCTGDGYGITTSFFPSPQRSFTVDTVDSATTFEVNSGKSVGIAHNYNSGGRVAPLRLELTLSILENSIA